MKKALQLTFLLPLALTPFGSSAEYLAPDYEVVLKKGTAFYVADFEVDRTSIRLFFNGDILRVPKTSVGCIRPVFKEVRGVTATARSLSFSNKSQQNASSSAGEMDSRKGAEEKGAARSIREELRLTLEAKEAAIVELKESLRSGNRKKGERIRKGILALQTQLAILRDEAKEANGGTLPAWWDDVWRGPFPGEG